MSQNNNHSRYNLTHTTNPTHNLFFRSSYFHPHPPRHYIMVEWGWLKKYWWRVMRLAVVQGIWAGRGYACQLEGIQLSIHHPGWLFQPQTSRAGKPSSSSYVGAICSRIISTHALFFFFFQIFALGVRHFSFATYLFLVVGRRANRPSTN